MLIIFCSCFSLRNFGSSRQIRISRWILFSLRDLRKGETRRFMMEKPRSTPEVNGGISNANIKSFILLGKLRTEPSEHIFEYTTLSFGLIVFKYSCISFCLISPWRTFSSACFLAWSFNYLMTSSKVQKKSWNFNFLFKGWYDGPCWSWITLVKVDLISVVTAKGVHSCDCVSILKMLKASRIGLSATKVSISDIKSSTKL